MVLLQFGCKLDRLYLVRTLSGKSCPQEDPLSFSPDFAMEEAPHSYKHVGGRGYKTAKLRSQESHPAGVSDQNTALFQARTSRGPTKEHLVSCDAASQCLVPQILYIGT